MIKVFICIGMLVALFNSAAYAQMDAELYEWKLKKDASEIQVFTSKVLNSKFRAVSATMVLDEKLDSVVSLIMDLENCSSWAVLCQEAYVQEKISNVENYVYSRNDIPFPGRDRDAVTHVVWERDQVTGAVSMVSRAVEGRVPKVKGVIRIEEALAKWRFTPQEDGTLLIESFAHVNPASQIPSWLLNRLLVGSPYKTMKAIRNVVAQGAYDNAVLSF